MAWQHTELIRCPECGGTCRATVTREDDQPWASYVHVCEHCGHIIMESEWERIKGGDANQAGK